MSKHVREIRRLIEESKLRIAEGDCLDSIENLEQALEIINKHPLLTGRYLEDVLWPLGNMYGATKQYEKAVEIEELEIRNMLERHHVTYLNNVKLSEKDASQLISLYLCLGTAYMNLEQPEKARNQYVMGYTLAYTHFGEYDERTLKQAYNIACGELISGDHAEGIRQLKYCYYDMRDYLGESSEYTQKAKRTLLQEGENPEDLYAAHVKMRQVVREDISQMWK